MKKTKYTKILLYNIVFWLLIYVTLNISVSQTTDISNNLPKSVGIYVNSDKDSVLIGDFVNLEIIAAIPQDSKLDFSALKDSIKNNLQKCELISSSKTDTIIGTKGNNLIYLKTKYIISCYEVGKQIISSFYSYYTTQNINGFQDTNYVSSNNLYVYFAGVGVDTAQAFKDIKPPIEVEFDYTDYILWAIFAIFLGGLIYWLVNYLKNKKPIEKPVEVATPIIPAHILALEELRALESEKLWQNGKDKIYYTKLTEILRVYIERLYHINSMEMTTDETLTSLKSIGMNNELMALVEYILIKADFVKFAKYQSIPEDNINSMKNAIEFIKKSHI